MQNNSSDKPFKPGIGIDFGTSNSAAAVFDGEQVRLVQLSELNPIMPSANYIDRDFASTIGQPAIDDYISDNQGRKVELSVEVIGEARTSAGTGDGRCAQWKSCYLLCMFRPHVRTWKCWGTCTVSN